MRRILFICLVLSMALSVYAGGKDAPPANYQGPVAERPQLLKGDRWEYARHGRALSYEFMEEKDGQLVFEKVEDGTKTTEFYTPDLNFVKEVFEKGSPEVVKPYRGALSFPLWVGKEWRYSFSAAMREKKGMPGEKAEFESSVKVEGYEEVTVPAGTFGAFKIKEVRRNVKKKLAVGKHRTVWYSPDVKRVVKTEEGNKAYNRELTMYSPGKAE